MKKNKSNTTEWILHNIEKLKKRTVKRYLHVYARMKDEDIKVIVTKHHGTTKFKFKILSESNFKSDKYAKAIKERITKFQVNHKQTN